MSPGRVTVFLTSPSGSFLPPLSTNVARHRGASRRVTSMGMVTRDIAVALSIGSGVRLLLNNGAGTMSAGALVPTAGGSPLDVALANMDGGTDVELLAAAGSSVEVFSNNGTGTFTPLSTVTTTGVPLHLATGDLDGDGDQDVAGVQVGVVAMFVSMNSGSGALGAPAYNAVGVNPQSPCIADLDGDSDADIAVPNTSSGTVSLHMNNGAGVFSAGASLTGVGSPGDVSAIDMNGDGDNDLLVAGQTGGLSGLFVNAGGGVFDPVVLYRTAGPAFTVSCGDWSGDGAPDVAFGTTTALSRFTGAGDQLLRCARVTGHSPRDLGLADVDGDGDLDIVHVAATAGQIGAHRNDGSGSFGASEVNGVGSVNSRALLLGDLNGDGSPDVVTSGMSGPVAFAFNNGDGTFAVQPSLAVPGQSIALVLADFDADGDPDIASAQFSADVVRLLPNNGAGSFSLGGSTSVGTGPSGLDAGDLDGDGDTDLVVSNNGSDSISVLLNNGSGTFTSTPFAVGDGPQRLALGDLDGDGDLDIAAPLENAEMLGLYSNNGSGVFSMVSVLPQAGGPVQARIADVDGDGDNDVLVASSSGSRVAVFNNFGGFVFGEIAGYEADSFVQAVAFGDVDGNGSLDIVSANQVANTVTILRSSVPSLLDAQVTSDSRILVTFSEEVTDQDLVAASYTLSGSAKGTLSATPASVSYFAPGQRLLQWTMGEMFDGGDATITINGSITDVRGNKVGHVKSRTDAGGGIGYPPTAEFSSPGGDYTVVDTFDVELVFNEKLGDFSESDLVITGAEFQGWVVAEPSYTIQLRATAEGPVTVELPAGSYADLAGNAGLDTESITVTYDATAPGIVLSSTAPDPTNAAIVVTAALTEPTSDFTAADVTGTNATVSGFSGSGASYSWTLTPVAQGSFSCSVAASMFSDGALHPNTASNSLLRTFDSVAPGTFLSTSAPNPTNSAMGFTVILGEASTNFTDSDVAVTNGTVSGFTGTGTNYSWTVNPSSQGAVTCRVPAGSYTDAAGNANTASGTHTRTYDSVSPNITLGSTTPDPTNGTVAVTATTSEGTTSFTAADVSVTNASLGGFSGSGTSYSWTLTAVGQGSVSCQVNAGVFADAATNGNTASNSLSRMFDSVEPTVTLTSTAPDPTNGSITVQASLSESSADFTAADVSTTNASVSGFSGSGASYSWTLTAVGQGAFSCEVPSGAFADAATNTNAAASNTLTRTFDSVAPGITLASVSPAATNAPIPVTATLTEPSANFDGGDVSATNATVSGFSGSGTSYSWTLTPLAEGVVECSVASSTFADAAANANASGSNVISRTYDTIAPALSLTTVDATRVGPAPMPVDFSATDAGSGIASGQVHARLAGETTWSAIGSIGGGVGSLGYAPVSDGVYELTLTALDAAGNGVATPGAAMLTVIYNADGGAFTHAGMSAGTHLFPMTDDFDVELAILGTPSPAATITVDRVVGDGAPAGLNASRLIDEHLVITGSLNSATASVKWPFDPASTAGLVGTIEKVFQVEGGSVTGDYPATVAGGAIEFGPVASFSEWWAGNQPSSVDDWMLMDSGMR